MLNPDGTKQNPQPAGYPYWQEVSTDPATGSDDLVWIVTLCQSLLLNLGESPFYAQYGIPAEQSVIQQVWPDYYVARTQQLFAQYFASLIVSRVPGATKPTCKINVTTTQGTKINMQVPQ
jgi:hypothetical protein